MSDSLDAEHCRAKAAHAREMAAQCDGPIQKEWLTLAEDFDHMAGDMERARRVKRASPTTVLNRL